MAASQTNLQLSDFETKVNECLPELITELSTTIGLDPTREYDAIVQLSGSYENADGEAFFGQAQIITIKNGTGVYQPFAGYLPGESVGAIKAKISISTLVKRDTNPATWGVYRLEKLWELARNGFGKTQLLFHHEFPADRAKITAQQLFYGTRIIQEKKEHFLQKLGLG